MVLAPRYRRWYRRLTFKGVTMKSLLAITLFSFALSASAAPKSMVCQYDRRSVDGGADKVSLTKMEGGQLYALEIENIRKVMSGGAMSTVKTGTNAPSFGCMFSEKFPGLFTCVEITKDGFRGKATVSSKIAVDEINGEAFHIALDTATLTYNGSFAFDDCKLN